MITPGGLGPWFCSLFFNTSTSEKCKKQTHIVAHTYPHLVLDAMNRKEGKRRCRYLFFFF
jgi:hypothetical protein